MKKLTTLLTLILLLVLAIGSIAPWFSFMSGPMVLLAMTLGSMAGWSRGHKEVLALGGAAFLSIFLVHADWGNAADLASQVKGFGSILGTFLYSLTSVLVVIASFALVTRFLLADALKPKNDSMPT